MTAEIINVRGWEAVPQPKGGYYIYDNTAYDRFRGYAATEAAAREWLNDSSGATFFALPEVKRTDIRTEVSPWTTCSGFPYRGRKFQLTHYYHGATYLGKISVKKGGNRPVEIITVSEKGGCVLSGDLHWLCKSNGLRLIDS